VKLRLYHHSDGARVAYREEGTGPPLALLHSAMLSYKEFEPVVETLSDRFRVVLPDLPLHGDSEQRPHHPYTPDWYADVIAGFAAEVLGPRPLVGGHGLGAEILLHATVAGALEPGRIVLMPNRMHRRDERPALRRLWWLGARAGAVPGLGYATSHVAKVFFRPDLGLELSARGAPEARDLIRHAVADIGGDAEWARSWARFARAWPTGARRDLLDSYGALSMPVLLLWADEDRMHPLQAAEEALDVIPQAQLRVLSGTGFLIAYDDPVGVARELAAFCV
jgi:pimeloyl-ACP methyl ester carboxylesterase